MKLKSLGPIISVVGIWIMLDATWSAATFEPTTEAVARASGASNKFTIGVLLLISGIILWLVGRAKAKKKP